MKCAICSRDGAGELCKWHNQASRRLEESFKRWNNAKKIDWESYLVEVRFNPNTGSWVKEVVEYILQKEKAKK